MDIFSQVQKGPLGPETIKSSWTLRSFFLFPKTGGTDPFPTVPLSRTDRKDSHLMVSHPFPWSLPPALHQDPAW